jgi:POLQ-like helicase
MKPEQRSHTLLGITRSKAKMFEYDVPPEHHINIPGDPSRLFTLSIGILGDLAARSNENSPEIQQLNALRANLQFSARFFDAYMQGRFNQTLDPYLMLLGASSYYLCELPGSSVVLAQIIGAHAPDLGGSGLEDLLRWTLQGGTPNTIEPVEGPYAPLITGITAAIRQFFIDGSGMEDLLRQCDGLKRMAYDRGSPRQLLLADVLCAVVRKKCSNSSWQALPQYTNLSHDAWLATLQKPGFMRELWPAQHLLGQSGVLRGASAIVQMPTSAGKTRATELIIRSAFLAGRTSLAVIVAPFRALCHEIRNSFVGAFRNEQVNVDELSDVMQGDFEIAQILGTRQILVVTPEKFAYVLRHTPELASHIGVLVFDEGHQFDSGTRGITYELLLTSLKSMLPGTVQKILISAVITNASALGEWLNGPGSEVVSGTKLVPTFRTVGFVSWTTSLGRLDFVADGDPDRQEFFVPRVIEQLPLLRKPREKERFFPERSDGQAVALLLALKLVKNGAVAIFCGRKDTAANLCAKAVEIFDRNVPLSAPVTHSDADEARRLAYLHAQNLGLEAAATRSATLGIFAHHGNTPHGIRLAVEHAMRTDRARFVICTSTLAQGVNLPIRYLLVTSVYQGAERIKVRDFHNLIGRAGRSGMHTEGSILFADADVYDGRNREDDKWRWKQVKELLEPANSEPCISSLLAFFDPLRSDRGNYTVKLEILEFVTRYISDPASMHQLAQEVATNHADKGFTRAGLEAQIARKASVVAAIESFLMSHWDTDDSAMTIEGAVALANGTLAYFLANTEIKDKLLALFRILAENVAQKVVDPARRKVYGKALYGVADSQAIEAWVRAHLAELLAAETAERAMRLLWPFLLSHNQNPILKKCSKPEALENLTLAWISGQPFNLILRDLKVQEARLIWGTKFREFTIEHVVDMCEYGLAFDASLLLGAVTELVAYIAPDGSHQLIERLNLLQKMLKYGLSSPGAIVLYELGFSDRPLVAQLSLALNLLNEPRRDVVRRLTQRSDAVNAILENYPSYFSYVANHVI